MTENRYAAYRNATADFNKYSSLVSLFEESVTKYQQSTAFSCMGAEISYQELDEQSKQFAAWLQAQPSLNSNSKIALMMPNILQYPVALFGVLRAGMIAVNVNPLYTAPELAHQLKDAEADMIVVLENFAHVVEAVQTEVGLKHIVTTKMGDLLPSPKAQIVNLVVKYVKKMVPKFNLPDSLSFRALMQQAAGLPYARPELTQSDTAFLQYTGGTTGVSKGAVLSHGNILANMMQAFAHVEHNKDLIKKAAENGISITALPLYHIFSLTANCFLFFTLGAHNVLVTNPRDIPGFVKILKASPFVYISGVNTLFNALLANEDFAKLDFSKVELVLGGGMAVHKSTADKWEETTGSIILEAYGLTECSPAVCVNPLELEKYNGSIGFALAGTELSVRDDAGNEVPTNEEGELCVKGPQVMSGYWNNSEETAKVFAEDGFFKTGDVARIDAEGFVYIVDRKKDMILVSGFNVYPNEIEDILTTHPDIVEAACVGVPCEESGECVKAVLVLAPGAQLSEQEVIDFSRQYLTGYKTPDVVEFMDELPKNNVGKVLRKDLRS